MSNNIIPFEFEGHAIRVIDLDGEAWLVASDVCNVLGLTNPTMALRALDDDEFTLSLIEGSHRETNLINESGFYSLVLRSDKPQAKPLRKWVTSEVLPSIRKTGQYSIPKLSGIDLLIQQCHLLKEQDLRLTKVEADQTAIKSKLAEYDSDTGYMTVLAFFRSINCLYPTSKANEVGRKASKICEQRQLKVGRIPDERYGQVNSYPVEVLQEVLEEG